MWQVTTWMVPSQAIKTASEPLCRHFSARLGIYEQQVGDQSRSWQILQTQRFIQLIKNCRNVFSADRYLVVYLYGWGFISCQWARWEAPQWSSSGPDSYRGCDDRIRSAVWLLCGIQMPIPLPSAISSPLLSSLSLSFVISPPSLPSPVPQCLSGLVISCHPL